MLGLGAATLRWGAAAEASDASVKLITRPIPSSGEGIPVIGVGTNRFTAAGTEAVHSLLARMQALGATVIDTAAIYGSSEELIGQALADLKLRDRMFIATKFDSGRRGPPPGAPPPGGAPGDPPPPMMAESLGGEASFQRSLERLRTDHVDLLQVHGLNGTDELMPLLLDWKKSGKVRYIGVTTSDPRQHGELIEAMRRHPLDFIQVDYSIDNREAANSVLPLAQQRRIGVLANLPLGRAAPLQKLKDRALPAWAASIDATSWAQVMLKYVVSHPAITCAIPGSTKLDHLEDNQLAGRGRLPDPALRQVMEKYWDSVF